MEGELSTGMKILLVIVLLMVIIGVVFGIFSFVTSNTEEQQGNMEGNVSAMTSSVMNKYDQTKVSGSNVMAAIQLYKDDEFVVVVQNLKQGSSGNPNGTGSGDRYGSYDVEGGKVTPFAGSGNETTGATVSNIVNDGLTPSTNEGSEYRGKNLTLAKKTSSQSYIRGTAKYNSFLIRDEGQQVVGIYFIQTN